MKFRDPANPEADELREWAADPDASYPEEIQQDFDLIVADWNLIDTIVELAGDEACPNRQFFVSVLDVMVQDCVRTRRGPDLPKVVALLNGLSNTKSNELREFRARSVALLRSG